MATEISIFAAEVSEKSETPTFPKELSERIDDEMLYSTVVTAEALGLLPSVTNEKLREAWYVFRRGTNHLIPMPEASLRALPLPFPTVVDGIRVPYFCPYQTAETLGRFFRKVFFLALRHTSASLMIYHQNGVFRLRVSMGDHTEGAAGRGLVTTSLYPSVSRSGEPVEPVTPKDYADEMRRLDMAQNGADEEAKTKIEKKIEKAGFNHPGANAVIVIEHFDDINRDIGLWLKKNGITEEEVTRDLAVLFLEELGVGRYSGSPHYEKCAGCGKVFDEVNFIWTRRCTVGGLDGKGCGLLFCVGTPTEEGIDEIPEGGCLPYEETTENTPPFGCKDCLPPVPKEAGYHAYEFDRMPGL